MKNAFLFIVLVLIFSCKSTVNTSVETSKLYEVLTEQSDGGGNIQFYEILTEPNEIKMLLADEFLKDKIKESDIQNSNFVILNMGEKKSGGYSIGVSNVEETATTIVITVIEENPDANAMVTQNITYPYTILKINSKKEIKIN